MREPPAECGRLGNYAYAPLYSGLFSVADSISKNQWCPLERGSTVIKQHWYILLFVYSNIFSSRSSTTCLSIRRKNKKYNFRLKQTYFGMKLKDKGRHLKKEDRIYETLNSSSILIISSPCHQFQVIMKSLAFIRLF